MSRREEFQANFIANISGCAFIIGGPGGSKSKQFVKIKDCIIIIINIGQVSGDPA